MRKYLCPLLGSLILGSMFYAAWLTSDWRTILACAPAILGVAAIVSGLVAGVVFFGRAETARELSVAAEASSIPFQRERHRAAPRTTYNERKIKAALSHSLEIPEKYTYKRKRPREVAQVVDSSCTGCGICVPFCPADCIETEEFDRWPERALPPVRVRYDECIGCGICMRVCAKLAWDATIMRPVEAIEREEGIVIHDTFPGRQDLFAFGV